MEVRNLVLLGLLSLPAVGCVAVPGPDYGARGPEVGAVTYRQYNSYPQPVYRPAPRNDTIDARQRDQQQKIAAGIRSGELTKKEAEKLKAEQRAISREESAYKSDGYLSNREKAELQREQQDAQRNIQKEKNDSQDRD